MILYFDRNGALKEYLEYGSPARAGTSQFKVIAIFEQYISASSLEGVEASIKLYKPDLNGSSYPLLIMEKNTNFVFDSSKGQSRYLTNGQSYCVFEFNFGDFGVASNNYADEVILLDTPGLWKAVVTLISDDYNVQGIATINVQDGIASEDETEVTLDLVLANIASQLATKLDLNSGFYLRVINGSDIDEGILDFDNYGGSGSFKANSVLFTYDTHKFYILNNMLTGAVSEIVLNLTQAQIETLTVGTLTDGTYSVAVENIVTTNTAQNISGLKTFSVAPRSTVSPSNDYDLVNLDYLTTYFATINYVSNNYVAKAEGMGLSHNDFTDALKSKLEGIEAGAQVNTIEEIQLNNTVLNPINKIVNIDLTANYYDKDQIDLQYTTLDGKINAHIANTSNPHQVTKAQVGLGNVVNTGDSNTPTENGTTKFTTGGAYVLKTNIDTINSKIPNQASASNQLADKDFVNSTVNSLAAFYITKNAQGDPFATYAELASATVFYSGGEVRVPTRNDYCIVVDDENHDDASCRYIYQGGQWEFQFVINETPFTSDQLAAINSGITAALVSQITTNANNIENKVDKEAGKGLSTNDFTDALKNKLDGINLNLYVLKTTTIAGIDLQANIAAQALTNALIYATDSDIEGIMED